MIRYIKELAYVEIINYNKFAILGWSTS